MEQESPPEISEDISSKFRNMSGYEMQTIFSKIRKEINSLQNIYYTCSVQSNLAGKKSNYKNLNRFQSYKRKTEKKLNIFKEESIAIIYEQAKRTNFTKVDLHGLHLDEAEEIIMILINSIHHILYRKGRNKGGKKNSYKTEIITGKGRNSKGKPILFPKIRDYLESQGYKIVPASDCGKMDAYITL